MRNYFSIYHFLRFCQAKFKLTSSLKELKEKVCSPSIPGVYIAISLILRGLLGAMSFLALDQIMAAGWIKRLFGVKRRRVCSDTTIVERLEGFELEQLRDINFAIYKTLRDNNAVVLETRIPELRRNHVGWLDGTHMYGGYYSVLCTGGRRPLLLDLEPYEKRGKELPASRKLIKRVYEKLEGEVFDFMLLDGLYATKEDIQFFLTQGTVPIIKVKKDEEQENKLLIFRQAEEIAQRYGEGKDDHALGIYFDEDFDTKRGCEWSCHTIVGLKFPGIEEKFIVSRFHERYRDKEEVFFVTLPLPRNKELSTKISPLIRDVNILRELGHQRWFVENNCFKAFSAFVNSKHIFSHKREVCNRLAILDFIGFNLFMLYSFLFPPTIYGVKTTVDFFRKLLVSASCPPIAHLLNKYNKYNDSS